MPNCTQPLHLGVHDHVVSQLTQTARAHLGMSHTCHGTNHITHDKYQCNVLMLYSANYHGCCSHNRVILYTTVMIDMHHFYSAPH